MWSHPIPTPTLTIAQRTSGRDTWPTLRLSTLRSKRLSRLLRLSGELATLRLSRLWGSSEKFTQKSRWKNSEENLRKSTCFFDSKHLFGFLTCPGTVWFAFCRMGSAYRNKLSQALKMPLKAFLYQSNINYHLNIKTS